MNAWRKVALGVFLAGLLTCAAVSGQQPLAESPVQVGQAEGPGFRAVLTQQPPAATYYPVPDGGQPGNVLYSPYHGHSQATQLAQQYVKAEKEEQKREIRKKLTDLLNQQFEQQSQRQQRELEELEKQIAKLRATLRKRLEAKSTIIERRIDQLIQDAEGLGWNAPASPQPGALWAPRSVLTGAEVVPLQKK